MGRIYGLRKDFFLETVEAQDSSVEMARDSPSNAMALARSPDVTLEQGIGVVAAGPMAEYPQN